MIEIIIESVIIGIFVFFISYYYGSYRFEKIVGKIKSARAFSLETAVTPEAAGITSEWDKVALKRLVKEGKLAVTEDGRYYVIER